MRILDRDNNEIFEPDLDLGYIVPDKIFIRHHDAIQRVDEQWHYRETKVYMNGGRDLEKVVDIPGVDPVDEWDEYEDVYRYVLYTKEELDKMNNPSPSEDRDSIMIDLEYRISQLEKKSGLTGGDRSAELYRAIKRSISGGKVAGMLDKIKFFSSINRLSSIDSAELIDMIKIRGVSE